MRVTRLGTSRETLIRMIGINKLCCEFATRLGTARSLHWASLSTEIRPTDAAVPHAAGVGVVSPVQPRLAAERKPSAAECMRRRSMHPARQPHHAGGIARDADIHALAAEGQIAQGERIPARRKDGRIRLDEPRLADAQSAEAVDQTLQISAGARQEVLDIVTGRLGAYVERRLERAAGG